MMHIDRAPLPRGSNGLKRVPPAKIHSYLKLQNVTYLEIGYLQI